MKNNDTLNTPGDPTVLSKLLMLEKSGQYEKAMHLISSIRQNIQGQHLLSPLNLKLIEERIIHKANTRSAKETGNKKSDVYSENATKTKATWSAVITLWKRKDYLAEQLDAIKKQSISAEEIIIILNERHIEESEVREVAGPDAKIIVSDINSLYTRWAVGYIAKGVYVSVFDDDIIPGEYWIENAIRASSKYHALVGSAGRIYNKRGLHGYYKLVIPKTSGTNIHNTISCDENDVYCDWVCNSYLFKREWVGHILNNVRYKDSFKTFDDIQLATALFVNSGIQCVTPMQPEFEKELHGSLKHQYGNDAHAIWKTNSDKHFSERRVYLESLIRDGYAPVQSRENLIRFHLIVPFGERHFLERCLLSIKGQDYQNFTCTFVDDCCDGSDAVDFVREININCQEVRYLKTRKKTYPLRAREIATDSLNANLADVIVHLDGDDWFPYPDVLSRLNRIYRTGDVHVSYGNSVSVRSHENSAFRGFSQCDMSKKWNVAQQGVDESVFPFRRLNETDVSEGWARAPWFAFHLRSFKFVKWVEHNRKSFVGRNSSYLRVATDAAIMIPILDSCEFSTVVFNSDLAYVYQNVNNTIHSKKEILPEEKQEALATVLNADAYPDRQSLKRMLLSGDHLDPIKKIDNTFIGEIHDVTQKRQNKGSEIHNNKNSYAVTIVTPNYLPDAIICLKSYQRSTSLDCQVVVYVATESQEERMQCQKILDCQLVDCWFPSSLEFTGEKSEALVKKYTLGSDEYRWGMKPVLLEELLSRGADLAVFLDPDLYTVSDITDIHRSLFGSPISVFPHFRDPDHEYLRGVLYKDGFFNGGMLAATQPGNSHLVRLYNRCLNEMVKNPATHRWDDQKYFDLFVLEVDGLKVNQDRGVDYNYWNYEPVEGLIAPSQRSFLLKSGYFVRNWHISTTLVANSIKLNEPKFSVYRPVVAIYLLSILFCMLLLIMRAKIHGSSADTGYLGFIDRFRNIDRKITDISESIPLTDLRDLLDLLIRSDHLPIDDFLETWGNSFVRSICFDNLELFARIIEQSFPDNLDMVEKVTLKMRRNDLRYMADEVTSSSLLDSEEKNHLLGQCSAGELIRERIQTLQACNIKY